MKPPRLWHVAIAMFCIGMVLTIAPPANAGVGVGEVSFTWGQVCVLCAVAAAWGDMRATTKSHHERLERLEKKEK